jgi:hypothetical protein
MACYQGQSFMLIFSVKIHRSGILMGSPCSALSLALLEQTVGVIVQLGWRTLSYSFTPSCLHIPIHVITLLPACIGCDAPVKWAELCTSSYCSLWLWYATIGLMGCTDKHHKSCDRSSLPCSQCRRDYQEPQGQKQIFFFWL